MENLKYFDRLFNNCCKRYFSQSPILFNFENGSVILPYLDFNMVV